MSILTYFIKSSKNAYIYLHALTKLQFFTFVIDHVKTLPNKILKSNPNIEKKLDYQLLFSSFTDDERDKYFISLSEFSKLLDCHEIFGYLNKYQKHDLFLIHRNMVFTDNNSASIFFESDNDLYISYVFNQNSRRVITLFHKMTPDYIKLNDSIILDTLKEIYGNSNIENLSPSELSELINDSLFDIMRKIYHTLPLEDLEWHYSYSLGC